MWKNKVQLNVRVLQRYVDDLNMKSNKVPLGTTFNRVTKQLEVRPLEQLSQEELNEPDDLRTANVVKEMANSIIPMFQRTVDCPSANPDHKLPVLDLKLWVSESTKEDGSTMTTSYYEFYRKPMANPTTIPASSAGDSLVSRNTIKD